MNKYCAFRVGDVVRKNDSMGLVIKAEGRFMTYTLIDSHVSTHVTTNLTISHYLKVIKSAVSVNGFPLRNLTLEQELLEAPQEQQTELINGRIDRLSETQKIKEV